MTINTDHLQHIVDDYRPGDDLGDAMRRLTLAHAEHLRDLGPVGVLALDPCPRCGGRVIAGETVAKCAAGCDWSSTRHGASS